MGQFAYAFSLTLIHSLWQSALLLLIYTIITGVITRQFPNTRRNLLYSLLIAQVFISMLTFAVYYSGSESIYAPVIAMNYLNVIAEQPLFQSLAPYLVVFYLFIIGYKSISMLYHWNKFKSECKQTFLKPSLDLKLFTMEKAYQLGIKRKVSLWFSETISTPITFGFLKPVVLMPVALLNHLTVEEAETLILHELTHIKNNDYLLNFILIFAETLFFFNPFISSIISKIRLEREKNCDVHVLNFKYSSLTYAETLLKAAKFRPHRTSFQLAAVSKNKQLLNRILFFTSEQNLNFRKNNYSAVSYFLILVVCCINLFAITEYKRTNEMIDGRAYAYIPSVTQGYNADKLYDFETMTVAEVNPVAPVIEPTVAPVAEVHELIPTEMHDVIEEEVIEVPAFKEENFAMHASTVAEPVIKEVIINEENSATGQSTTKAYQMIFTNGQWIAEPLWIMTESKTAKDSTQKETKIRPFHIIQ